jgi:UDP-N-acetylmuramate--alanine ligase
METKKPKIHFMGAGGSGCSAAFALARHFGYQVTGCDKEKQSPYLEKNLAKNIQLGHSGDHLEEVDILVYSPAIVDLDPDNEELRAAQRAGKEAIPWEKFVAKFLAAGKFVVAVTGTHGKGTVTAMVATILEKAGFDPSCLVGAVVNSWGKNYRVGGSKYFVVEVDEYKERFLSYKPDIAAITNVEFDHPEYFKDFEMVQEAFKKFVGKLKKGSVLVIGPNVDLQNPHGKIKKVTRPSSLNLRMIGEFNKMNAAVAASLASKLGVNESVINKALEGFKGIARRFEFKGEEKGVLVFDDYAHHPTAISETLKAAREKFPDKRIWLVFQPHLFTRTKVLFDEFVSAFEKLPADEIVLVDIFAAREKDSGGISSEDLGRSVKSKKIKYIPDWRDAATHVASKVLVGDVIISAGAGDIYKFADLLLSKLRNKE